MRLATIRTVKQALSNSIQSLTPEDISFRVVDSFRLISREPVKRKVIRLLSPTLLQLQQRCLRSKVGFKFPDFKGLLCMEERFGNDASLAALLAISRRQEIRRVLIPGCYLGSEDVQFWLRRGVKQLDGIDVYLLQSRWSEIIPKLSCCFGATVRFLQGSIEAIPFEDAVFDLVATSAVIEHTRNLEAMVEETARVLRPRGLAWHCFGPLYYAYGGDHCMTAYGEEAGYDHLMLMEEQYQQRIKNQVFFDRQSDPNLPFWALRDQFSFATVKDYLDIFERRFVIKHLVLKISQYGLKYRRNFPKRWRALLAAGVSEEDLLIKSIGVVLQKREGRHG